MTRERMLEKLYNLKGSGLDLRKVLMRMSNPQEKFRSIRVGGTNGKGSTCVFLAQILRESGYRVGLFTSPHLSEPEERIEINGEKISREGFQIFFERSWHVIREIYGPQAESEARFFEVLVAMALDYFAEQKVELAIIEAGVGGRRDDTNVVHPILSILTNVDLDHGEVLGNTLQEIAHEKAGLAPPGVTLLTAEEKPEVLGVIEAVCQAQRSELIHVDFSRLRVQHSGWEGQRFDWGALANLETRVLGRYQLRNAATALTAIELLNKKSFAVSEHAIREGLRKAYWSGRMELLQKRPYVLLDGAKNPAGLRALKNSLSDLEYEHLILVLGIATRKDIFQMVQEIIPGATHAFITQAPFRGSKPELIAAEVQRLTDAYEIVPTPALALERALTLAQPDDLVCVTGSLFLLGEVRSAWLNRAFAKAGKIG